MISAQDATIVAFDMKTEEAALALLERPGGEFTHIKVASKLWAAGGPAMVKEMLSRRPELKIMLDLKLYDIPHQMVGTVEVLLSLGVDSVTVHSSAQIEALSGCVDMAGDNLTIVGVTVLTSMDDWDVRETYNTSDTDAHVCKLAQKAHRAGIRSLVCSGHELATLKKVGLLRDISVRVPGIRSKDAPADDQARKMTPAEAIAAGAKYLVVGRPITQAKDPLAAYGGIVEEVVGALGSIS